MTPARSARPPASPTPGDGILHPGVLLAVGVLALNDHVFKAAVGGWLTGKLSDVAGMVFFPVFLQAAIEKAGGVVGRRVPPSRGLLLACAAATALVFSAVQIEGAPADLYRAGLGLLQWPARLLAAALGGRALPGPGLVQHTADLSDIACAPFVLVGVALAWGRAAVTPGAVTPGAVSSSAVSPGAVSSSAVSPGAVSSSAVSPGAVSPGAVSPGAVPPCARSTNPV